jgi:hypothetical protein
MRNSIVIGIAAIALCGCATSSSSQLAAKEVCMRAGFTPEDRDYAECVQFTEQYRRETRREKMRKELDIANHPAQQAGIKFFYNGPVLGRGP